MGFRWPIEIDGLPINNMVIFHGELLNNQMVILQLKICLGNVFTNSCKIGKRHQNSPIKWALFRVSRPW